MSDQPAGNRRRNLVVATLLFLVIGALWWGYEEFYGQYQEHTENAQVDGDLIRVMPQIGGTVVEVLVEETDYVTQGQLLVSLDDTDARVRVNKMEAQLALAVRDVVSGVATIEREQAQVANRRALFNQSAANLKRRRG